jgi:hypothetical protein
VSPVKYELDFYIPKDGILNSHRRENLKSKCLLRMALNYIIFSRHHRFCSQSLKQNREESSKQLEPIINGWTIEASACQQFPLPVRVG